MGESVTIKNNEIVYRNLTENIPGIVYIVYLRENNRMEFFNKMVKKLTGYNAIELKKGEVCQIDPYILPEDRKKVVSVVKDSIKKKKPFEVEYRFKHKSGDIRYFSERGRPLYGDDKKPLYIYGVIFDITSKKHISEELAIEQFKLKEYFENLPMMAYNVDFDGNIADCNNVALRTLGYKNKDELKGKSLIDTIYAPSSHEKAKELFNKWKQEGKLKNEELQVITKNGKVIDVLLNVDTIFDYNGKPVHSLFIQVDISERKKFFEKLKESEEKYRLLIDGAHNPITIYDIKGTLLLMNVTAASMLDGTPDDFVGKSILDIHPSIADMALKRIRQVVKMGTSYKFDTTMEFPSGKQSFLSFFQPVKDSNGKVFAVQIISYDVTERKNAEEALKESEEKYRSIFESSSEAIVISDINGNILDANSAASEILGYDAKELIGATATLGYVHPEQRKLILQKLIKNGYVNNYELEFKKKDGSHVHTLGSATLFRNKDGKVERIVGIFNDVTNRKKMEKNLKESEKKYRSFVENFQGIAYRGTKDFGIEFFHGAVKKMTGYSENDFVEGEVKWTDIIHKDDLSKVLEDIKYVTSNKISSREREYRIIHKNGKVVWIHENLQSIFDDFGKATGAQGVLYDITKRKETEAEREKLFRAVETTKEAVSIQSPELVSVYTNDAMEKLFGYEKGELIGKQVSILNADDMCEATIGQIVDTLEKKGYWEGEVHNKRKDGSEIITYATTTAIKDKKGKITSFISTQHDITEMKKSEEALKESEEKYSSLVEQALDAIVIVQDRVFKFANTTVEKIFGYKPEELIGTPVRKYIAPESKKLIAKRYLAQMAGMKVSPVYEAKIIAKDGTKRDIEISAKIIKYLGKKADMAMIRDVTDRKKTEEKLKRSEENYKTIFNSSSDAIFIHDISSMKIVDVNDEACRRFGYTRDELKNLTIDELSNPDFSLTSPQNQKLLKKVVNGETISIDWLSKKKNGELFWHEMTGRTIMLDGKPQFLASAKDINERKKQELEMKKRLMRFNLEEKNVYLVKEHIANKSINAFQDLLNVGYSGIIISRSPKERYIGTIHGDFNYLWIAERDGKNTISPKIKEVLKEIEKNQSEKAILIDRLDYLITKNGFKKTLLLIQQLTEIAYINKHIIILTMDPDVISQKELKQIEKETFEIEPRKKSRLTEDLHEIIEFVYKQNLNGVNPSYSEIGKMINASKPTVRTRIRQLVNEGYLIEKVKGRRKVVETTEKSRHIFS